MGTNYYWLQETKPACEHCGRPAETDRLHIGKSSAGWCFSLHVTDEIKGLVDWEDRWASGGRIENEYGEHISVADMRLVIMARAGRDNSPFDYAANHAEPGPAGLVRHRIGPYCVGHGEGTWDLIPGHFS
jgi:hypothetical protein